MAETEEKIETPLPIVEGDVVEGAEIEVAAEDIVAAGGEAPKEEPAAPEAPPAPEKKPKNERADRRVAVATARAAEAERANETLAQENERLKREMAATATRATTADHAALDHFEARTKAEHEAAKRALAEAHRGTDPDAIAEATSNLSKAAASLGQIENFRAANPKPDPKAAPKQEPRPERRQEAPVQPAPELAGWMAENPWFDPTPGNKEFNHDMHTEAALFGRKLERQYLKEGRGDDVAGDEYWRAVDDHMRAEYPEYFGETEPEQVTPPARRGTPTMTAPKAPVAPAKPSAQPGAQPAGSKTKVSLTPDERKMAHSLAASGAMVAAGGARITPQQAEVRFAARKLAQSSQKSA